MQMAQFTSNRMETQMSAKFNDISSERGKKTQKWYSVETSNLLYSLMMEQQVVMDQMM